MIEEILLGLSEKLKSKNFLDCDSAVEKIQSLLQSQTTEKQKKIIKMAFPLVLHTVFTDLHKKMVRIASEFPLVLNELLPQFFNDSHPSVRYWSLVLMVELKQMDQGDMINIANSQESDEIIKFILDELAKSPNRDSVNQLLKKVSHPSPLIKNHSIFLLTKMGEGIFQFIKEHFYAANSQEKYDTIQILPQILKGKALGLFQKMIEADGDGKLLPYIVAGIGHIRSKESLQILLKHLEHPDLSVREEAKSAMKKWGSSIIEPLLGILKTSSPGLSQVIMEIVGHILGKDAREFLDNYFVQKTDEVKVLMITAIAQDNDDSSNKILLDYLLDPSVFVRKKVKSVLKTRSVRVLDLLLTRLGTEDESQLLDVIDILGDIGSKEAIRPLMYVMDHNPRTRVQAKAIEAMTRLQKFETVASIVLLKLYGRDMGIRHAIIDGFSKLTSPSIVKDLVVGLLDRNPEVHSGCLAILEGQKVPGISILKSLLDTAIQRAKEGFLLNVGRANGEQILEILKKGDFTLDDFQEKELGIKVLKSVYSKDNITDIKDLLIFLKEEKGSDLHMSVDLPPSIRVHGELIRTTFETLTQEKNRFLLLSMLNPAQKEILTRDLELDFSYEVHNVARFRCNIFTQKNGLAAVFRIIPNQIPNFDELNLEKETLAKLCKSKNGLILVTGATGSGKSTTLAAMIDHINRMNYFHLITIEDPIEFVHPHKRSVVSQRELGTNTRSFEKALKSALREDPDVILVGEMRDLETMKLGITASETGHLVFSTLHTNNAYESVHRLVSTFPGEQHEMVRIQLAGVLRGIISQRLLPTKGFNGRVLAYEILVNTAPVRRCIKDNKIDQISSIMQTSAGDGMITLDKCLTNLVLQESIEYDTGYAHATDKKTFEKTFQEEKARLK